MSLYGFYTNMFLTENMSTLLTDKRLAYYVALLTDKRLV